MMKNIQTPVAAMLPRSVGFSHYPVFKAVKALAAVLLAMLAGGTAPLAASNDLLAEHYPESYTIVVGDTLWDIAKRYLRDPWCWQEIWRRNPGSENPDILYSGDVLVMTFVDGRPTLRSLRKESHVSRGLPTLKLSPGMREISYRDAIPVIDPGAIQAYLNSPLVTNDNEMRSAGYVIEGVDGRLLMGKYDQFYARGIEDQGADEYRVFRPGRHFVDPLSNENLGWEAEHMGDARMLQPGDPARLTLLNTYGEVTAKDRLRPIYEKMALPFFYPKAPKNKDIRGMILPAKNSATSLGPLSVVALNLGERDQVRVGDVFRILSQEKLRQDPIQGDGYRLPEEEIGLLMVFKTFEKVSYALVTNATRAIALSDIVVSPER